MKTLACLSLFFIASNAFGQACPNGICPPAKYDLAAQGDTVDQALSSLQAMCAAKDTAELPDGYKKIIHMKDIKISWNSQDGQYAEGKCLIQYMPKR